MKKNLSVGALIVIVSFFLVGFIKNEKPQSGRTEDYALLIYSPGSVEKNVNGKSEFFKLEGEKVDGLSGKNTLNSLAKELAKLNEEGFEIVNVSTSVFSTGQVAREVYLFRRKR